ncbi:hypothetical protein [Sorangium sp. So ce341]|uniref:hypothetical protein n=1 Tax=Sorangium sp. So ce341 TaxID=3133302 RepID=UPI003F6137CF
MQTSSIAGDITGDECVDKEDFDVWDAEFGVTVEAGGDPCADLNHDGWIDELDYVVIIENWEKGPGCDAAP